MASVKSRVREADEVDITPMIDIVFQLIIFFMVVMAIAVVYGVAIKFPPPGQKGQKSTKKEKNIVVYVGQDRITTDHVITQDGVLKINGEEIPFTRTPFTAGSFESVYKTWQKEREEALDLLQEKMKELIDQGYKTDVLMVQGDMKSYHGKIMRVIDRGKREDIKGFSLIPPIK